MTPNEERLLTKDFDEWCTNEIEEGRGEATFGSIFTPFSEELIEQMKHLEERCAT